MNDDTTSRLRMSSDNENHLRLNADRVLAAIDLNGSMILHGAYVGLECN